MVLDVAAEELLQPFDARDVLELVEGDEAPRARPLEDLCRKVEQLQEDALDVDARIRLQRRGEASCAERQPDLPRPEQRVDGSAHRPLERAIVRPLDADDEARQGEDALEIDKGGRPSGATRVTERPPEEAGLSIAPRSYEARRVTAFRERKESCGLDLAVDHVSRVELARDAEGVRQHDPQSAVRIPSCLPGVDRLVCFLQTCW